MILRCLTTHDSRSSVEVASFYMKSDRISHLWTLSELLKSIKKWKIKEISNLNKQFLASFVSTGKIVNERRTSKRLKVFIWLLSSLYFAYINFLVLLCCCAIATVYALRLLVVLCFRSVYSRRELSSDEKKSEWIIESNTQIWARKPGWAHQPSISTAREHNGVNNRNQICIIS